MLTFDLSTSIAHTVLPLFIAFIVTVQGCYSEHKGQP